jgi:fumarylacetoacetase
MKDTLNSTHDSSARSWVSSASQEGCDFTLQNLPYGVFSRDGERGSVGVAIGDQVLDVAACADAGLLGTLPTAVASALHSESLNRFMSLGAEVWSDVRRRTFDLLHDVAPEAVQASVRSHLVPMRDVVMRVPAQIGDYTDFYASVFHATNVGSMFRPDNPLLPNYKWVPIAYHGRASTIVVSGTSIVRPCGQTKADDSAQPVFGPTRRLDYELEVGMFVGAGNRAGEPIPIAEAEGRIFGLCLVNDWSARDIQAWEYQPLGPFLAKNFLTSVSPWVVTMEALAPFRVGAFVRPEGDPSPLPYLACDEDAQRGGVDMTLEVYLTTAKMRESGCTPQRLSRGSFRDMYWTLAQMLTHHASNGCKLNPGDLLASGTVSGSAADTRGCLLELTRKGSEPITLPTGEQRRFLENDDEVVLRGYCARERFARIGFGECRGVVVG